MRQAKRKGHRAENKSVERDFGLAAPLRSAANPKRLTLGVGATT